MTEEIAFEEALKRLKESVEKLDQGDMTLDEMVSTYEEGTLMAKRCQEVLDEAKGRVLSISNKNGDVKEEPYE